jgi:transposase
LGSVPLRVFLVKIQIQNSTREDTTNRKQDKKERQKTKRKRKKREKREKKTTKQTKRIRKDKVPRDLIS